MLGNGHLYTIVCVIHQRPQGIEWYIVCVIHQRPQGIEWHIVCVIHQRPQGIEWYIMGMVWHYMQHSPHYASWSASSVPVQHQGWSPALPLPLLPVVLALAQGPPSPHYVCPCLRPCLYLSPGPAAWC